jgi:hypothetical protein
MEDTPTPIKIRLTLIRDEYTSYVQRKITENFRFLHLWLNMTAPREFNSKMIFLSEKYLDGIITDSSLTHLIISVKHMLYAIIGITASVENYTEETLKKFVKHYIDNSFEHMEGWNWLITDADSSKLKPIRDSEDESEVTPEENHGFPSWVKFRTGSKCSCCDDDDESVQYEESDHDSGCESE